MNNHGSSLLVENISVGYSKNNILLSNVSLEIPIGVRCAIIGLNGSGKTTLLNSILELIPYYFGKVLFFGRFLDDVRSKIAYVPQIKSVDWNFPITVEKVVEMGCYHNKNYFFLERDLNYKEKVNYALNIMNLNELSNNQINKLSGGQKQRVFIARALAQDADLYVLDEPFTGLDMLSEEIISKLFIEIIKKNKTVIAVHHDLHTLYDYFDWVVIIKRGIVYCGVLKKELVDNFIKAAFYAI